MIWGPHERRLVATLHEQYVAGLVLSRNYLLDSGVIEHLHGRVGGAASRLRDGERFFAGALRTLVVRRVTASLLVIVVSQILVMESGLVALDRFTDLVDLSLQLIVALALAIISFLSWRSNVVSVLFLDPLVKLAQ